MLQLVCIESVPQNPEIPHSNKDGDKGELTFLNGWSFQFVLHKALLPKPPYMETFLLLMGYVAQDIPPPPFWGWTLVSRATPLSAGVLDLAK